MTHVSHTLPYTVPETLPCGALATLSNLTHPTQPTLSNQTHPTLPYPTLSLVLCLPLSRFHYFVTLYVRRYVLRILKKTKGSVPSNIIHSLLSLWALNFGTQVSYVNPIASIKTNVIRRARKVILNQWESPSSNVKMSSLLLSVKLRFWV